MNVENFIKFKGNGYYYNVYGDDAYIIAYIMKYKLIDRNGIITTGFPCDLLNEVLSFLDKNRISYIIDDIVKDYGNLNQYKRFVKKDIPVISTNETKRIYSGNFSVLFLDEEEVEYFEIGTNISSDAEIVKLVSANDINSICTLKSNLKFKIVSKNIK